MAKAKEPTDLKARLSRKIAELTMVVHLLFTRNHEREVEIEALKAVYGREIRKIDEDVKGKVSWLEGQLEEFEKARVMLDIKNTEITKHKQQTQLILEREGELKRDLEDKNHLLSMAQKDIIKLRDQVVSKSDYSSEQLEGIQQLRDEIEKLKKSNEELMSSRSQKHKTLLKQIEELQTQVKSLNSKLQAALMTKAKLESQLDGQENNWQAENDKLQIDITELTDCQKEDQERYAKLESKNKQLQLLNSELQGSSRQLSIQIQQLINDKNRKKETRKNKPKEPSPEAPRCTPAYEKDEELERLRREVQRYRLEISNRESNFNRVFSEQKPVLTGGQLKRSNNSPDQARFPNLTGTRGRTASMNGQVSPPHLPSLK